MPSIAVDSSIIYALFNAGDRQHENAVRFLARHRHELITNLPVLTEVAYLLAHIGDAQRSCLAWVDKAIAVDEETMADIKRIVEIMAKYADLPADFADAALVAMCERLKIDKIATLDKDFAIYRLDGRRPFNNIFDKA